MRSSASQPHPSLFQFLPPSLVPLDSHPLPSHSDLLTTSHLTNLLQNSAAHQTLQAYLHSLDLPPPNKPGTGHSERKLGRRERAERREERRRAREGGEGSEEEGETGGGETVRNADGEESGQGTFEGRKRKVKKPKAEPFKRKKLPRVEMESMGDLSDLPPGDLLHSIHAHTSTLFASSHLILPHLTKDSPFLPPPIVTHLDTLHAELVAKERAVLLDRGSTRAQWEEVKGKRADLGRARREGMWKNVWTDAERGFEGSALVAVGLFVQILAEELVRAQQPQTAQAQTSTTTRPADSAPRAPFTTHAVPVASTSTAAPPVNRPRPPKQTQQPQPQPQSARPSRPSSPALISASVAGRKKINPRTAPENAPSAVPVRTRSPGKPTATARPSTAAAHDYDALSLPSSSDPSSDSSSSEDERPPRNPALLRADNQAPGRRQSFLSVPRTVKRALEDSERPSESGQSSAEPLSSEDTSDLDSDDDETSSEEVEEQEVSVDEESVRRMAAGPSSTQRQPRPFVHRKRSEAPSSAPTKPARLKQVAIDEASRWGLPAGRSSSVGPASEGGGSEAGEGEDGRAARALRRRTVSFDPAVVERVKSRKKRREAQDD